jgi:hypothetical protein
MPKQHLNGAQIRTGFEQMRGKAVAPYASSATLRTSIGNLFRAEPERRSAIFAE